MELQQLISIGGPAVPRLTLLNMELIFILKLISVFKERILIKLIEYSAINIQYLNYTE